MRGKLSRLAGASLLACSCVAATALAENWPQWRGPNLNGTSGEKNLPVKWGAEENVAWKLALPGWSGSTPIIWGERVFLNVADGEELWLWCVDKSRGALLWKRQLGVGNHRERKQNMSSPSPATDGKGVYAMTGTGALKGFDFAGRELWARDIQKDYGAFGLNWGYASSPLLYDDALYVQVLHGMKTDAPSYVLRIDKATGKTVWRVERPTDAVRESPDAYTTPSVVRDGKTVEIVVAGGDVTQSHLVWSAQYGPDVPTPATDGVFFYIVNDRGVVWCLDAKTGKELYGPVRIAAGTYSASPVVADGKVYITNEDGLTTVFKAGTTFEVLAENALGDYCLSSPAVSDGQIFIRTSSALYCIGKRAAK